MIRRMETATLGAAGVAKALARSPAAVDPEIHRRVEEIVAAVRLKGDAALLEFTERFDRVALTAG
ncbi:MAG: histidinol dehydrogenase, partial [Candidatus Rokubacteria bacterium]|nr:histidinol dehydrogenase [Candidatus Rokubacteria bacterium]